MSIAVAVSALILSIFIAVFLATLLALALWKMLGGYDRRPPNSGSMFSHIKEVNMDTLDWVLVVSLANLVLLLLLMLGIRR